MEKSIALALTAAALASCATVNYDYSKEPDPRKLEYVIGPSDRVRITVWKNPDLATEMTVRPDGTLTMPLLGDLQVTGLTPTELKREIMKRLTNFIRDENAVVTVAVTDCNSYRFTVAGNVEKPGIFTSRHIVTVAEAVAMAGGLNKFASPGNLVIVRKDSGKAQRRIPIDFRRVTSGEQPEANLGIMAGDTVFAN